MCAGPTVESVDKGNGDGTVKMLYGFYLRQSGAEQSIPFTRDRPSSVPCVAVFILTRVAGD